MFNSRVVSTLEYYNYGENNDFRAELNNGRYDLKISDKEGNIITIDKDGALYGSVSLDFKDGVLSLLDVGHDNKLLADVELEGVKSIDKFGFNKEAKEIVFEITYFNGGTDTFTLDVNDLIDIYESGQGINIEENFNDNGKKKISIKLADGEELLHVDDEGLSLDSKVITEEELATELEPYAKQEDLESEVGRATEAEDALSERIDGIESELENKANSEDLNNLEDRVDGIDERLSELEESAVNNDDFNELEGKVSANTENIEGLENTLGELSGKVDTNTDSIEDLGGKLEELSGTVESNKNEVDEVFSALSNSFVNVTYETGNQSIVFYNKEGNEAGILNMAEIFNDEFSPISDVKYNAEENELVFILKSGAEIKVDMRELLDIDEAGNGLEINEDGKIVVKIDEESESYLTVSENGLKISGVNDLFDGYDGRFEELKSLITAETERANTVEGQLWDGINQEAKARQDVDNQQWTAINGETEARQSVDAQLWEAIGGLRDDMNESKANQGDLSEKLEQEIENRRKGDDNTLTEATNAVANEKKRALDAESDLKKQIDEEAKARAEEDEAIRQLIEDKFKPKDELRGMIEEEINNREAEDAKLSGLINDEASARQSADDELKNDINSVKDEYATKVYSDTNDENLKKELNDLIKQQKDEFENSLKETEENFKSKVDEVRYNLTNDISDLQTQLTKICAIIGVSKGDGNDYVMTPDGNGILNRLHGEVDGLLVKVEAIEARLKELEKNKE